MSWHTLYQLQPKCTFNDDRVRRTRITFVYINKNPRGPGKLSKDRVPTLIHFKVTLFLVKQSVDHHTQP